VRERAGQVEEEEEDGTGMHNQKQAPTQRCGEHRFGGSIESDGCRTLNRAITSPVKSSMKPVVFLSLKKHEKTKLCKFQNRLKTVQAK
jgi:hypothetical protein